ncbi:MAG: TMEM175 family protein [Caldilineales bacterium]
MAETTSTGKSPEHDAIPKRPAPFYSDKTGLERLIFFSDAVFAIAITLLALEIRLPEAAGQFDDREMWAALLGLYHEYLAYFISFLVIGSFWMAHHRKFRLIDRYDNRLLSLNLLVLMSVAFIPFASSVISVSSTRSATDFCALTIIVVGLLFTGMWSYASRGNRLARSDVSERQRRREFTSALSTVAVFAGSIVLSFFDVGLARLSWMLILPFGIYVSTRNPTT